ncbi:uncharacterized protein LOC135087134 [Ostrinia nubilalis]|uniref:uncharacterized protein LOC135087134 n=1 Tax=Ostrinia nubilalis TaxID=29057 RepID=UPI0030824106
MSVQRSPTRTSSQPDLSTHRDDDPIIAAARKRKGPECHCNHLGMMEDFYNKIMTSFNLALESQNKNIKCALDGIGENLSDFKKQMSDINSSIKKISDEHSVLKNDISVLKSVSDSNTQRVSMMANEIADLQSTASQISDQLRLKEQQGRINNLEITGIPVTRGENLNNIIHTIAKKVGFALLPTDIDYIHRVRRFNSTGTDNSSKVDSKPSHDSSTIPNIIVRFTQRQRKNELLAAVRARRGMTTVDVGLDGPSSTIYVSDHLAPHNKLLYKQTRILAKQNDYKYVWLSDCKIFVRKNDASRVQLVSCEADLNKLKK